MEEVLGIALNNEGLAALKSSRHNDGIADHLLDQIAPTEGGKIGIVIYEIR